MLPFVVGATNQRHGVCREMMAITQVEFFEKALRRCTVQRAVAGSRGSVSAPAVSRVMGGAPERPPFLSLSVHMSLSLSVVPHPVFLNSGLSLRFGDVDVSSCNPKFFAVRHIHYPVNPSNDYLHNQSRG